MYLVQMKIFPDEVEKRYDRFVFSEVRLFDSFQEAVIFGREYSESALSKINYEIDHDDQFDMSSWRRNIGRYFSFCVAPMGCQEKGESLKFISMTPYGEIMSFSGLEGYVKENFAWLERDGYLKRRFSVGDLVEIEPFEQDTELGCWGCVLEIEKEFPFRLKVITGRNSGRGGVKLEVVYKDFCDPTIQLKEGEDGSGSLTDLLSRAAKGEIQFSSRFYDLIKVNRVADNSRKLKNCKDLLHDLEENRKFFLSRGIDYKNKSYRELRELLKMKG